MEASSVCAVVRVPLVAALSLLVLSCLQPRLMAASHRTENFIVTAQSKALAVEIAEAAEKYRVELAVAWLGEELPRWHQPCPISAKVNPRLGAGGATSFLFDTQEQPRHFGRPTGDGLFQSKPAGRPFGWEMSLQGSRERVLDSVLPHEVTHTIFATHFGRPLPRWADEGACTTVEHPVEKAKQYRMLYEFLKTDRGIAFNRMFAMTEYPADILPLYSQGFSLARFLIAQGGRQKFIKYIGDGLDSNDWTGATKHHYGYKTMSELQLTWLDWVRSGSPDAVAPDYFGSASPQLAGRDRASAGDLSTETSLVAIRTRDAVAKQKASRESSSAVSTSWYAKQKLASQSERAEVSSHSKRHSNQAPASSKPWSVATRNQVDNRPTQSRRVSRPEPASHQREVLIEWGNPSPFLSPRLAERGGSTIR